MKELKKFDLIVIGAGPAGYVAAIKASQLGIKNIAILEKENAGGTCLNWGCIPSKSLIHQANIFNSQKELKKMGIKIDNSQFDYGLVYKASRKPPMMLSKGVEFLLKKNNIMTIKKKCSFQNETQLTIEDNEIITADNIIIATGATPKIIPGIQFDEKLILSSKGALSLKKLPKKALIIGSGAIGVEFSYIWNSFGTEVTMIEMEDSILPNEDKETSLILKTQMIKDGIKIKTSATAKIIKNSSSITAIISQEQDKIELEFDLVLVAIGTTPETTSLKLENTSIKTDHLGFIKVDNNYQTTQKGIYAIGDVINTLQLAHAASCEAEIAAENIALHSQNKKEINYPFIPKCIYSNPQIASFGITEQTALNEGIPFEKSVYPYRANGKAVSIQQTVGHIKIIRNSESKKILGVSIIGCDATEIIHELLLICQNKTPESAINKIIYAHPTLSEIVPEAIMNLNNKAIHI